jgi:hypothetical protein
MVDSPPHRARHVVALTERDGEREAEGEREIWRDGERGREREREREAEGGSSCGTSTDDEGETEATEAGRVSAAGRALLPPVHTWSQFPILLRLSPAAADQRLTAGSLSGGDSDGGKGAGGALHSHCLSGGWQPEWRLRRRRQRCWRCVALPLSLRGMAA